MNVYIKPNTNYFYPVLYVLKIIEKNLQVKFRLVDSVEEADVLWDHLNKKTQVISQQFYDLLKKDKSKLAHSILFKNSPEILDEEGNKDIAATIFYMINCLQEYAAKEDDLDQYGRYKFESSYQSRFNVIEKNLVQHNIDQFVKEFKIKGSKRKSAFFVSHDIDTIYGSFMQDGYWAVKNLRIDVVLKLLSNLLISKPHWRNIDKILKINTEYDVRSTFFWLVNKGYGTNNIKNADYDIKNEQALIRLIEESGFTNGLHKSSSEMSLNDELQKGNFNSTYNRYHFINFSPVTDWKKISDSKIDFDSSLGFAERYGFRNSYGTSFQPFNIEENKPYDFIEAPLNFMDGTFHKYMKIPSHNIANIIIDFFEKNAYNCLFTLLWHNTYFTDYKYNSFLDEYKKIMGYIYETKIDTLSPDSIINESKLSW